MASLKFQKSALAISFSAALLSMFVASPAQSANDFGELIINGQISNTTCLLTLGDGGATGSNSRTINLGTFSTATAGASGIGSTIGNKQHAILGLKAADGVSPCTFIGSNTKWDVGVNISPENIDADVGTGVLKNTAATNAATGVGVQLMTTVGALGTTAGTTPVNFANSSPSYGTLLSGSATSALGVLPAQVIAVTVQMVRTGVIGAGVFTHSIPLNVWYQ